MTTSDSIALVGAVGSMLQAIVVLGSVFFLYAQIKAANATGKDAERSFRVLVHNATADALNRLNELLASNSELRAASQESNIEILCHLRFNRFEQIYCLHRERVLDDDAIQSGRRWMHDSMQSDAMIRTWQENRRYYREDFARWLDNIVADDMH